MTGSPHSNLLGVPLVCSAQRRGFTLIELMIVVVIIGILAALAIPKFANSKEKAIISTMKSDLRNLVSGQESYFVDHQEYYSGPVPAAELIYSPSAGVSVEIAEASAAGWSASASSAGTTRTCAVFLGDAAPLAPATASGVIACDP